VIGGMHRLVLAISLAAVVACDSGTTGDDDGTPDAGDQQPLVTDPFTGLATGLDQWNALCSRGYGDMISTRLCQGQSPPVLTSLGDLRALLGLTIDPNLTTGPQPNVRFTFNGHSTALPQRHVSPINPRQFVFTIPNPGSPGPANQNFQVLAFARGEAFVELLANDPTANDELRFFVIRFHPQCEQTAAGCNFADLYTPTIESNWTAWSVYDDGDLANTTLDCKSCHQPGGPGTQKIMRMQELNGPWLHWFYEEIPENHAQETAFLAAHQNELYGGVPNALIEPSRPFALHNLIVNNGFGNQPNEFDSMVIRQELMTNGTSPTWNALYDRVVRGLEIAVPYAGVPQTDPAKIAAMTQAYRDVMNGVLPRDQMPDLRDVFRDDLEDEMSHRPKPGLDGRGILVHMCSRCHNSRLDQTLSRANFNVDNLDNLPRAVKDKAIMRLQMPPADIRKMPPDRFSTLSQAEIDAAIAELAR
jgi:hypothetical protein